MITHGTDCSRVKCDCCGEETLAEIRGDKVIIADRRHGRRHVVVLTLHDIIESINRISASSNPETR